LILEKNCNQQLIEQSTVKEQKQQQQQQQQQPQPRFASDISNL